MDYRETFHFQAGFEKIAKIKKNVQLQPHQQDVAEMSKKVDALLLYHMLGSGKTLSAINSVDDIPTDLVVPASLRENARKELKKFTTSNNVNLKSYHKFIKEPSEKEIEALILDEAHRIGNPSSQLSKSVIEAAPRYKKRLLLTGSPIRNHPSELAPLIKVLAPDSDIPLAKSSFEERFIEQVKQGPGLWGMLTGVKGGIIDRPKNVDQIRRLIKDKVSFHETSHDKYPTVIEKDIPVLMSKTQQDLYSKTMASVPRSVKYKIEHNLPLSKTERLHLNSYLNASRRVSNSVRTFGIDEDTPKMSRAIKDIKNTLREAPNAKTVSYSNYLQSGVRELARKLDQEGIPNAIFDGSLDDKSRKKIVDLYNSGKIKSLLISGAGSEGLDLKGTRLLQILEPHWHESRTDQVKGRAIRYMSHADLPPKERKVEVRNYMSVLPRKFFGLKDSDISTDQFLRNMGKKKTELNKQFLDILKEEGQRV